MTNLRVLRNDVEWETRFDGDISSIEVNGRKLNDIHDVSLKIEQLSHKLQKVGRICLVLALLCFIMVTGLSCWLLINHQEITTAITP